jgi:HEPN domain-containing protein
MTALLAEWLAKAEGDYRTAEREARVAEAPNFDAVCFHAQQCVEKLMKALLIQRGVTPPRTHDLTYLDRLLLPICPDWQWPVEDLRFLTRAAVAFRYPGESADGDDAAEALTICARLRARLLTLIGS